MAVSHAAMSPKLPAKPGEWSHTDSLLSTPSAPPTRNIVLVIRLFWLSLCLRIKGAGMPMHKRKNLLHTYAKLYKHLASTRGSVPIIETI